MIRTKDLLFRLVLGIVILFIAFICTRCKKEVPSKVETKKEQGSLIVIDSNYEDTVINIYER